MRSEYEKATEQITKPNPIQFPIPLQFNVLNNKSGFNSFLRASRGVGKQYILWQMNFYTWYTKYNKVYVYNITEYQVILRRCHQTTRPSSWRGSQERREEMQGGGGGASKTALPPKTLLHCHK